MYMYIQFLASRWHHWKVEHYCCLVVKALKEGNFGDDL